MLHWSDSVAFMSASETLSSLLCVLWYFDIIKNEQIQNINYTGDIIFLLRKHILGFSNFSLFMAKIWGYKKDPRL